MTINGKPLCWGTIRVYGAMAVVTLAVWGGLATVCHASAWPSLPPPDYEIGPVTATTYIAHDVEAECASRGVRVERGYYLLACYDWKWGEIVMPEHFAGDSVWWAELYRHEAAHARGHPHDARWPR